MRLREATGPLRLREATALVLLGLGLASCVLPVRTAPGVEGRVVDRRTGEPVEGAIVAVRWDGRYGDDLPDRERLGHAEATTGPDGRFRLPRYSRGGPAIWPFFRTEARVVGVLHPAYRCPQPRQVRAGQVQIRLTRAEAPAERRETCRPLRARPGEAEAYRTAWRELYPAAESAEEREERQQLEHLLQARASLGFGENCEGPVTDLVLAPGGGHVAFLVEGPEASEVRVVDVGGSRARTAGSRAVEAASLRRLAWSGPSELILWQPADRANRSVSPSIFAEGQSLVVWTDAPPVPASLDPDPAGSPPSDRPRRPLDPVDLRDEGDTRWQGRSFELERSVDPESGLPRDRLRVARPDGSRELLELPGEACGGARFGRPHYRIDGSARHGIDLRFVEGGCHAVRIDLDSGRWVRLDDARGPATCRGRRRMPPSQLEAALRGWSRDLRAALATAGADPDAAHALEIDAQGRTRILARDYTGAPVTAKGPPLPVSTPLRRIDVTRIAPSSRATTGGPGLDLLEPL